MVRLNQQSLILGLLSVAGGVARGTDVTDDFKEGVASWLSSPGWTLVELASGDFVYRGDSAQDTFSQNNYLSLGKSWRLEVDVRFRRHYADGGVRALAGFALFPTVGSGVQFEVNFGHRANGTVQIDAQWYEPGKGTWHNVLQTDWLPSDSTSYRLHLFRDFGSDHLVFKATSASGFYYWAQTAPIPLDTLNRMSAFGFRVNSAQVEFDNLRAISPYTPPAQPEIISQPEGRTVMTGSPVTFNVTAAGPGPLTFQWLRGKASISGATNSSYTIPRVLPAYVGSYSVIVGNTDTIRVSKAASLKVIDAYIRAPSSGLTNKPVVETFPLQILVPTGLNYAVQYTADFQSWNTITNSVGTGSQVELIPNPHASESIGFYRLIIP